MTTINTHQSCTGRIHLAGTMKRQRRIEGGMNLLNKRVLEDLRKVHTPSVRHVYDRTTDSCLAAPLERLGRGYRHVRSRDLPFRRLAEPSGRTAVLFDRGNV